MRNETFTHRADDGLELFVYAWLPDGEARGVVQIAHGMAEHAGRYAPLGEALAKHGYAAYAADERGHGKSVGSDQPHVHLADKDGWNQAVRDLHSMNRRFAREHHDRPIVVLGHSGGSFKVQRLMGRHPHDGVGFAFSGSNGKPPAIATLGRLITRLERLRLGRTGQSQLIHKMSFGDFNKRFEPARTEYDWLSRDEAEVDKYIADPLCGFVSSIQTWVDLLDALGPLLDPRRLSFVPKDTPLYIFAGANDPVGGEAGNESLATSFRDAGFSDVELRIYPDGRHEMLNEINRDEVTSDLIEWIDRVVAQAEKRRAE